MRSVDGDARDTNPLLQDLEPDDELHAAASMQLAGADAEEHLDVPLLLGSVVLEVLDADDVLELGLGGGAVLALGAAEALEDEARLVLAADLDEPAGGLGHEPDDDEEDDEREDLEGDGEAPDEGGLGVVVLGGAAAVSDDCQLMYIRDTLLSRSGDMGGKGGLRDVQFQPVGDDDAKDVEGKLECDKLAARGVGGRLGGPDGGDGVEDAGADAVEDARAEHPVCVLRGGLQGGGEDAPDAGEADGGDAAVAVAHPAAEEAAGEGAGEVVDCDLCDVLVKLSVLAVAEKGRTHNSTLQQRLVYNDDALFLIPVPEAHNLGVVAGGVDAAHEALVVAKEEDGEAGDEADGVEEGALVERVGDVVLAHESLEVLHGAVGDAQWRADEERGNW